MVATQPHMPNSYKYWTHMKYKLEPDRLNQENNNNNDIWPTTNRLKWLYEYYGNIEMYV